MKRIHILDSLRGIAALQVLLFHVNNQLLGDLSPIASYFINGISPVAFFFVLSGFVLSYPYFKKNNNIDYYKFIIKRIFRIYPLYIVILILVVIFQKDVSFIKWIQECSIFFGDFSLLYPAWTLEVEIVGSLFIPFLILLRSNNKIYYWCFSIIIYLAVIKDIQPYILNFIFGVEVAYLHAKKELYKFKKFVILISALGYVLINLINIKTYQSVSLYYNTNTFESNLVLVLSLISPYIYIIAGLFSIVIISCCLESKKIQSMFNKKVFILLGNLSYGIYLTHFFILFIFTPFLDQLNFITGSPVYSYMIILTATFLTSTMLSYLLYNLIEIPFIKLGKRLIGNQKQ